ncbi:MAG: TIM barrel protein [Bacteroidota bacterium]
MNRRDAIKNSILATSAIAISAGACSTPTTKSEELSLKGKVKHSACRWCYSKMPLEELAESAQELGMKSIELLNPDEWDVMLKRGLTCAISNGSELGIVRGFNDPKFHAQLRQDYEAIIPQAADKGITQIICFSGNRNGMSNARGLENCAVGLDPIIKMAEQYNVKIVMELLNSKVDHADYMCDHTDWGVALAEKIGSEHFKLLYDIYHMQIMEGDVIATIRKNKKYISHFHTGGVPGRNEINETQELNYKAIMQAIHEGGYDGFVAQEFIPTREDAIFSLREGIEICDV